jgi:hypothetical protein
MVLPVMLALHLEILVMLQLTIVSVLPTLQSALGINGLNPVCEQSSTFLVLSANIVPITLILYILQS